MNWPLGDIKEYATDTLINRLKGLELVHSKSATALVKVKIYIHCIDKRIENIEWGKLTSACKIYYI